MLLLDTCSNPGLGELLETDLAAQYGTAATRASLRDRREEFRVRNSADQTSGPASAGLSASVAAPQSPAPERTAANMPKQNPRIARQSLSLMVEQVIKKHGCSRIDAMAAVVEAYPDLQEAACNEATLELVRRQRGQHIRRLTPIA